MTMNDNDNDDNENILLHRTIHIVLAVSITHNTLSPGKGSKKFCN